MRGDCGSGAGIPSPTQLALIKATYGTLRLIKGNGEDAGVIHGVTAAQCERGKAMIEQDWASREKRSPQELKTAECARAGE